MADTLFQSIYLCQVSEQRKRKSGDRIAACQVSPFPGLPHMSGRTSLNHTSCLFKPGARRQRTAHSTNPTFSSNRHEQRKPFAMQNTYLVPKNYEIPVTKILPGL